MTGLLARVADTARSVVGAVSARDDAIRSALAAGHSLREVAVHAGVSHDTVRRIRDDG